MIVELPPYTHLPLKTVFYDAMKFENLKNSFSAKEILSLIEVYHTIEGFNERVEYLNSRFHRTPDVNYFLEIEASRTRSKIRDQLDDFKRWKKN